MDYSTGICKLEFAPDHSDMGQWTCKFIVPNENADMELGTASVILLNALSADERLGWIVGALTAVTLFLLIIVVVLVVCKTRFFVKKSSQILETLPPSRRKKGSRQGNNERYIENTKIDFQFSEVDSQNVPNINSVLPNRSPHLYERVEKYGATSGKVYENVKE